MGRNESNQITFDLLSKYFKQLAADLPPLLQKNVDILLDDLAEFWPEQNSHFNAPIMKLSGTAKRYNLSIQFDKLLFGPASNLSMKKNSISKTFSEKPKKTPLSQFFSDNKKEDNNKEDKKIWTSTIELGDMRDLMIFRASSNPKSVYWPLIEMAESLIEILSTPKKLRKHTYQLCNACYRFFITSDWRQKYCKVHMENRSEKDRFIRLLQKKRKADIETLVEPTKDYVKTEANFYYDYIGQYERSTYSTLKKHSMFDQSITNLDTLARSLTTECFIHGNDLIETAEYRLHAILSNRKTARNS